MTTVVHDSLCDVQYKNMWFLITHTPTNSSIAGYIAELKKRNVKELVSACELSYSVDTLESQGIHVVDLSYTDGSPPPVAVVHDWLELLNNRFKETPDGCVAVHCVSGLGRAPVLVAIALMELGMQYEDAVQFIRERRRGAINAKQLQYLSKYKARSRLKTTGNSEPCKVVCCIL